MNNPSHRSWENTTQLCTSQSWKGESIKITPHHHPTSRGYYEVGRINYDLNVQVTLQTNVTFQSNNEGYKLTFK